VVRQLNWKKQSIVTAWCAHVHVTRKNFGRTSTLLSPVQNCWGYGPLRAVFFIRRSTRSCCQTAYTVGRSAFLVAGARTWNDLPVDVTSAPSLLTFRKRLKLHLFRLSYSGLVL